MELKKHGQTKKKVKMRCKIDDPNAKVKWFKDGVEIKPSDPRFKHKEAFSTLVESLTHIELTNF